MRSGRVEVHADHPAPSVQRTPFPGRGDSAVRPLVPTLSPRLRARSLNFLRSAAEVDPSCIWRWVQAYAPELNKRCRPHLKPTNKSYRTDETYIKVKGENK